MKANLIRIYTILIASVAQSTIAHAEDASSAAVSLLEVRASSDSSKAYIGTELPWETAKPDPDSENSYTYTGTTNTLKIIASAPIKKGQDQTTFASIDGFQNAFTLEGAFTRHLTPGIGPDAPSDSPSKYFGISTTIAHQQFEYLNAESLDKDDSEETTFGLKIFATLSFARKSDDPKEDGLAHSIGFSLDAKNAYKDAETKGFTLPPDENGRTEVRTGPYGAPIENDTLSASIEYRRFITETLGIGIKALYDFEKETFGVSTPLYFVQHEKSGLAGGVELAWREDTDKVTISVIVGTPFGTYP